MRSQLRHHSGAPRRHRRGALAVAVIALAGLAVQRSAPPATAAACSTSTGASSCTINTSLTVTAGTLTLEASPNVYWSFVQTGYDQWVSGSSAALTGCAASGATTTCSSGATPKMVVLDATGSGSGWAISEYLTTSNLPSGTILHFNGAGSSTIGNSQVSPIATDPFTGTTPGTVCDYASTCTTATAASTCSHAGLGFSACPTYPDNMGIANGTSSTQVDLFSAQASSGLGAVCFASGTATATGCVGTTSDVFFNLGIKGNTAAGTYATTVINIAISSGP